MRLAVTRQEVLDGTTNVGLCQCYCKRHDCLQRAHVPSQCRTRYALVSETVFETSFYNVIYLQDLPGNVGQRNIVISLITLFKAVYGNAGDPKDEKENYNT